MRRAKVLLSFLLALAMVVTALVPATVQAAGKVVTVGTQAELDEALKDPEVTKIAIKAKKSKTLTIPEGDYSDIALVVEAANVKLNNYGSFKVVKIRDAKKYMEYAAGNTIKVTDSKLTLGVEKDASVEALYLSKEDAENRVVVRGTVNKVTVSEPAAVELTVHGTVETLNLQKTTDVVLSGTTEEIIVVNTGIDSHGTTLESAVAVDVRTKDFIEITLTEGSEGSDVIVKTEAGDVLLENKTETSVLVEEKDGSIHEAGHEDIVDTRDQVVVDPTPAVPVVPVVPTPTPTPNPEPVKYTVNFVSETASGSAVVATVENLASGDAVPASFVPNLTREGYTLVGWYIDTEKVEFPYTVTGDVTITAKWEAIQTPDPEPEETKYTVTFNTAGGTMTSATTVEVVSGAAVSKPADPTYEGYLFEYWYAEEANVEYDFTQPVTEAMTLTAKWKDDPAYAWDEESLLAAIASGGPITLRSDVTLSEKLTIEAGKNVVINLNGKKLTTAAVDNNYGVIIKGGLTINGDGNVVVGGDFGWGLSTSGTPSLTINGGTFTHSGTYMIGVFGGVATINGGTFNGNYCVVNGFVEYDGYAVINGGTFNVADVNPDYEESVFFGNVYVKSADLGTTTTSVSEAGTTVSTVADFLDAVASGGAITLGEDITLTEKLTIAAGKDVIINLNGKKLTTFAVAGNYGVVIKGNLTINGDGNVVVCGDYGFGLVTSGTPSLTINGGTFTHESSYMIGVFGGVATINGGTFNGNYCIVNAFTEYSGEAYVNGGTYTVADVDTDYEESIFFGNTYVKKCTVTAE